ncbi:MAG: hypothetical protein II093_04285, partial [Selenomonas sp.]|nr:hypothetical protein [Selenomonas sp.]
SRDGGEQRQMYKVICADCGKETEVPFEPKDDRPVYCRDCFNKRRAAQSYMHKRPLRGHCASPLQ